MEPLRRILQGVAHLSFHAAHLDHLSGGDQAGLLASLIIVVALARGALLPDSRTEPVAVADLAVVEIDQLAQRLDPP
jgi:hypothetical protein